jgi:hypothetical protein
MLSIMLPESVVKIFKFFFDNKYYGDVVIKFEAGKIVFVEEHKKTLVKN